MNQFKHPVSVLVVIYTPALDILLLERASHAGYWQSVTGSREGNEALDETARREVFEETGLRGQHFRFDDWQQTNTYEIFPEWRYRYAPGVTQNTEHVFSLEIPIAQPVRINPDEHLAYAWHPWQEAAKHCFSASNRDAILALPARLGRSTA